MSEQKLQVTPAQTIGPFYGYALPYEKDSELLAPGLPGTRGLLNKLHTRIYLPEDAQALANGRLLSSLPGDRRSTLIATREADGGLRFDIRLQGENETVFLAYPED